MEQERNPNKNAELSMEQNYNQIDGIINNLPVPPPEEKPLDKRRYNILGNTDCPTPGEGGYFETIG